MNGKTASKKVQPAPDQPRAAWQLYDLIEPLEPQPRRPANKRKATLQPHHANVLAYCFASRYVTASHVLHRFPSLFNSLRTTRHQLLQLRELGYLKLARGEECRPALSPRLHLHRQGAGTAPPALRLAAGRRAGGGYQLTEHYA